MSHLLLTHVSWTRLPCRSRVRVVRRAAYACAVAAFAKLPTRAPCPRACAGYEVFSHTNKDEHQARTMMATGVLLLWLQELRVLYSIPSIGPLVYLVFEMFKDVAKWFVIQLFLVMSFGVAFFTLYGSNGIEEVCAPTNVSCRSRVVTQPCRHTTVSTQSLPILRAVCVYVVDGSATLLSTTR